MERTYQLPARLPEDLERLKQYTEKLVRGEISAAEYRAFRVPQGVYEQRTNGTFMLRVRLPGGVVLPSQLIALSRISEKYGNGSLHVTTRQDIQIHDVSLTDIHPSLVELAAEGLSTKGGGGNTVRNVTACLHAGVCPFEVFDVTPYAVALTEFLLPDPISYRLPRKYKIALSGCARDCSGARANDLGLIATERNGTRTFTVYVAGGMGSKSKVAQLFEECVPAEQIHLVAEALKRVFDKHGNRRDKHHARLRFLVEDIGLARLKKLYEEEFRSLATQNPSLPPLRELALRPAPQQQAAPSRPEGFERWLKLNTEPQKQQDLHTVHLVLELGDITSERARALAAVIERFGDGTARTTQFQNLLLRSVHTSQLPALHEALLALELAEPTPAVIRNCVACRGASTCRLGICLSCPCARAVLKAIRELPFPLEELGNISIHISGCPNACGRHPLADIGLFGAARRRHGRLVPHYVVQLGGGLQNSSFRLAEGKTPVPARNVPLVVCGLLEAFHNAGAADFPAFVASEGKEVLAQLVEKYSPVPSFQQDKNFYFDWGAEVPFSLAGRGPGECGAGLFDLIEVDLASAREALSAGKLLSAVTAASRALLVTQGHEAKSDAEALALFTKLFIETALLPEKLRTPVQQAQEHLRSGKAPEEFTAAEGLTRELVQAVHLLYENMDQSLRFTPVAEHAPQRPTAPAHQVELTEAAAGEALPEAIDREEDFRGVLCPLNYVKTKLVLAQMQPGQVLSVLLDHEGKKNVPESIAKDGHTVLAVKRQGDHWRIVIRKG